MQKTAITAMMLGLILALGSPGYGAQDASDLHRGIEKPAPGFSLKDLNGKTVSFKAYRGRNVLLVFTTTWCPYCKREIPELKRLHRTYRGKLDIIAIYINESPRKVAAFVKEYQIPYTVLLDPEAEAAQAYGIIGVPTRVLVGKDGKIYCWMCRSLDTMLDQLINAKP